jgi:hypothetical protein
MTDPTPQDAAVEESVEELKDAKEECTSPAEHATEQQAPQPSPSLHPEVTDSKVMIAPGASVTVRSTRPSTVSFFELHKGSETVTELAVHALDMLAWSLSAYGESEERKDRKGHVTEVTEVVTEAMRSELRSELRGLEERLGSGLRREVAQRAQETCKRVGEEGGVHRRNMQRIEAKVDSLGSRAKRERALQVSGRR